MQPILIEACCGSVDDCSAVSPYVDRIELNSALSLGGLTPSLGTLQQALSCVTLPVMAMLRPRTGGFGYTRQEFLSMMRDGEAFLEAGAHGLVFGCLTSDGNVDKDRVKELVRPAGKRETVFHRAIDVCRDWQTAVDSLIELGVTRILTSGQKKTAPLGAETIRNMILYAQNRIEVLPAGGIRLENVQKLISDTGCSQIHFSRFVPLSDGTMKYAGEVHFHSPSISETSYSISSQNYYAQMQQTLSEASSISQDIQKGD